MTTAADYRQFAQECIDSARDAPSESARQQFLDLAQLWIKAAQHMDAREPPPVLGETRGSGPAVSDPA
jgi:hypothetical protein